MTPNRRVLQPKNRDVPKNSSAPAAGAETGSRSLGGGPLASSLAATFLLGLRMQPSLVSSARDPLLRPLRRLRALRRTPSEMSAVNGVERAQVVSAAERKPPASTGHGEG